MGALSGWWQVVLEAMGAAPPVWLFCSMALLPLVAVPASPFWILAGVRLGLVPAFGLSLGALLVNFTLGYWIARRWLRRPLTRFLMRRGWQVPALSASDEAIAVVALRLTPGVPLFAQNYLLGCAGVDFGRYLLFSTPVQAAYALAFVWCGNSLAHNKLWHALLALTALLGIGLGLMFVRRRLEARQSAP